MAEKQLTWFKKLDNVMEYDFLKPEIKWFKGGTECLIQLSGQAHQNRTRNKAAIIWEATRPTPIRSFTMRLTNSPMF
jgi:acetyl-CoA synthetase